MRISVRRKLLDEHLEEYRGHMTGDVLEIGAGRNGRRGEFQPPIENTDTWIYTNLSFIQSPHIQADVQKLPFGSGSFDTIVCLEVLEYVLHPSGGLDEIRRVLKEGGKLIVSLPFMHRLDSPTDFWRFTEAGIRRLFPESGFQITSLKQQGNALAVAVNILKHWIHISDEDKRLQKAWIARPLLNFLWGRDNVMATMLPILSTYSTGYLLLADLSEEKNIQKKRRQRE